MRVLAIGSTIKKTLFGVFRAIRTDDDGNLAVVGDVAVTSVPETDVDIVRIAGVSTRRFVPVDGGGQAINIGAAATRSAVLTVGENYHIVGEENCYIVAGNSTVDATTADYFLPAGLVVEYVPTAAGDQYISCIRDATDSVAGLHISRAS
jgi:hypothetical protein